MYKKYNKIQLKQQFLISNLDNLFEELIMSIDYGRFFRNRYNWHGIIEIRGTAVDFIITVTACAIQTGLMSTTAKLIIGAEPWFIFNIFFSTIRKVYIRV